MGPDVPALKGGAKGSVAGQPSTLNGEEVGVSGRAGDRFGARQTAQAGRAPRRHIHFRFVSRAARLRIRQRRMRAALELELQQFERLLGLVFEHGRDLACGRVDPVEPVHLDENSVVGVLGLQEQPDTACLRGSGRLCLPRIPSYTVRESSRCRIPLQPRTAGPAERPRAAAAAEQEPGEAMTAGLSAIVFCAVPLSP